MNKELIKKRFKRKLNIYNENARIQKQMAERLIDIILYSLKFLSLEDKISQLKIQSSSVGREKHSILEIGCGTGLLTELAVKNMRFASYTALDIVPECKNFIEEINPDIEFVSSDIEEYIESTDKKFDLIISNASLQWVENLPFFIDKLIDKLNPNGILLFSTFGKENFREIYFVLGKTLKYFSKQELEKLLEKHSPKIEEEVRVMAFNAPKEVLKHIQNTGVNAISTESWTKKDLINFEKEYNVFCSNHPTLTYNPIYVLIQK